MAPPVPFDVGEGLLPEIDSDGNPMWRNMWLNEMSKLQHVTTEQEKTGGDLEWYRMMVTRVRAAFAMPPDPQMGMIPHPGEGPAPPNPVSDEQ